jgi:hypothetical protein
MKLFLALLGFLMVLPAFAGKAVLMTSVEGLSPRKIQSMERKFLRAFQGSGLTPVIHHMTDPGTLYKVMTDEETEVVIWFSHAASERAVRAGLSAQAIIQDAYKNDVKNFFTLIPPRLRFLGVVGCKAAPIFDAFRERGNYDQHKDLEIYSFRKLVIDVLGYNRALSRAKKSLRRPFSPHAETVSIATALTISKENTEGARTLQSTWVEFGDRVLAYFDQDETAAVTATIPQSVWDKTELKNIKHNRIKHAGANPEESMGRLLIEAGESLRWNIFATRDGRILGGRDQHLYVFRPTAR